MPWWCYEIKINDVLHKYSANFVEKWAPSSQSDWKKNSAKGLGNDEWFNRIA